MREFSVRNGSELNAAPDTARGFRGSWKRIATEQELGNIFDDFPRELLDRPEPWLEPRWSFFVNDATAEYSKGLSDETEKQKRCTCYTHSTTLTSASGLMIL